ncbi:protein of unknown function [Taphrina deformans PYCC 5710]|uniref:Uncharacterized protein n=1 Tax=Taphrina deformans (strain PYCC 5710 / ATCC 11124 / CBS 356.35 / IMI 108563 / JCM 9778 / NBRC 8474) TaxID=1097556 RepID=R4XBM3_TAPDE|nr:protein of unknown function [Taphrina deformans PYCC 5710]|eukprot:CCG81776.1 protein of unknown function [Taphrina deformans PYCC 5710]
MTIKENLPFEAIAQFVASHENFQNLEPVYQLQFYALYKASHSRAPSYSFPRRLYLSLTSPTEYTKWLTWWVASDTYTGVQAESRYYELAKQIDAFPDDSMLHVMRTASTRGKGSSLLVLQEKQETTTSEMDSLIDACTENDIDFILAYLSNGGDVDIKNEEGSSLLHFAVDSNSLAIVEILLRNRVDTNVEDDQGLSPIESAKLNGEEYDSMVELLQASKLKS